MNECMFSVVEYNLYVVFCFGLFCCTYMYHPNFYLSNNCISRIALFQKTNFMHKFDEKSFHSFWEYFFVNKCRNTSIFISIFNYKLYSFLLLSLKMFHFHCSQYNLLWIHTYYIYSNEPSERKKKKFFSIIELHIQLNGTSIS